ncbi:hypothetical protein [Streptomyces sp. NPDC004435]|uniref:hypothetical protein n=1 Tax=Streptomyces sp. NPDC004435 TaxID=3364701 RepID=UPI00367E2121
MFLSPKIAVSVNRYIQNGPEGRDPSFKHNFAGRIEVSGGILRYSTTGAAPAPVKPVIDVPTVPAAALIRRIAKAGN